MWPVPDWGWGIAFALPVWWLEMTLGLLAVIALVLSGVWCRDRRAARRR